MRHSSLESTAGAHPHTGRAFEDILDGYFPLQESIRQMMERQRFTHVWLTIQHAPIMNLSGLRPTDPVPVTLPKIYAGMIDFMALVGTQTGDQPELSGAGDWFWVDARDRAASFPVSVRLGEPAFVRGVGLDVDAAETQAGSRGNVAVIRRPADASLDTVIAHATAELGWTSSRAWGLGREISGIVQTGDTDLSEAAFGRACEARRSVEAPPEGAGAPYVLLNTSPGQLDQEALQLALRV